MRNVETDEDFLKEVCDWLTANGVNPSRIPMWATPSIADGKLTIQRKVERNGRDVLDPSGAMGVLTETVSVPLLVEPPPDIAEWLAPRCPTCGR